MNKNVKLWIDALRSGDYRQGKLALRTGDDAWCCLGVACDVYQREVGGLNEWVYDALTVYDGEVAILPDKVRNWLGLSSSLGGYDLPLEGGYVDQRCLSGDNDNGKTFEEIAATIEAEPEGLFS